MNAPTAEMLRERANRGKLVQEGWEEFAKMCIKGDVTKEKLKTVEKTFWCGAVYVFDAIVLMMDTDGGDEDDITRMNKLADEFLGFRDRMVGEIMKEGMQ